MHYDNPLDDIDKILLNLIQASFPLTGEPYANLGLRLGIDGNKVISRVQKLKSKGLIRQISPVIDARSLGYQTTLVAMRVTNDLRKAEEVISAHQGVSHGYERSHYFNIWFTLTTPPSVDAEIELAKIASLFETEASLLLPALKLFKLDVYFDMTGEEQTRKGPSNGHITQPVELSTAERLVINEIQQELPFTASPYDGMAARAKMSVSDFLDCCQSLLKKGVMRRYGASLNHRKAGFTANAMTCWVVPPDTIDIIGRKLALLKEVSHCYERKTNPLWRYNLFTMIHGRSSEVCEEISDKISREMGLTDYVLLYSTKEFKKMRVKYLV